MTSAVNDDMTSVVEHFDRLSSNRYWSHLYEVTDGITYHFHVRRRRVLELLPERLGDVVDVGCGPGVMVEEVRQRGGTFLGIDLSPEMITEARDNFGTLEGVSFQEGNIEKLDLPDASFDQVICMAVIEYLQTPDKALAEMARVLRPGGTVIITVPKRMHIDKVTVAATLPIRALGRMLGMGSADNLKRLRLQPAELDAAAERAGLEPAGGAQYHFTPLPYPLPRLAPQLCLRLNGPFERYYASRAALPSFLAHGFIGRYRKPLV